MPVTHVPPDYKTPSFPSLYWLISTTPQQPQYLYSIVDIWRFTLYWTLWIYGTCHVAVSTYALIIQWRNWKVLWIVPMIYVLIAGIEAILAGSVVGIM